MDDMRHVVQETDHQLQQGTRRLAEHRWVEPLARFGFAAKGVVHALVGGLAVQAAMGAGGATTDTQGALQTIKPSPFGRIVLALIAVGLVGYVLWRLVQAGLDTENKGHRIDGIAVRIGYVVSAIAYSGLALAAARLALGFNTNATNTEFTAHVMALPLGRVLVTLAGAVMLMVGGYEMFRGITRQFEHELDQRRLSATEQQWAQGCGIIGLVAHGVVLGLTGLFLVIAALQEQPEQAQGLGSALQALARQPFGPYLLAITALGLVMYGVFSLVQARYRRIIKG